MAFDWTTFALQTINFAILVWLLQRFFYRPVLRLVDARRAEIEAQFAAAHTAELAAVGERDRIVAERAGIVAERTAALKEAERAAEELVASRRTQAERETAALIETARRTIASERQQALSEARRAAFDLATSIAGRLIAEIPPALRSEASLTRLEKYFTKLPQAERDRLAGQLGEGATLRIVTAARLPPDAEAMWRTRLSRTLGSRANFAFDSNFDLIAGVELQFPNTILRFSWRDALAAMRQESDIDARADAA